MPDTKKELVTGVFWSGVEKYSSLVVSIIITMILARILSPKDYGVVAIATVIIHFLQLFCSMGIGPAIIQKKELTPDDINSIFSFTVYLGLILSIVFWGGAYIISSLYNSAVLVPVCQLLSIQVFFSAANMVPNALMLKDKRFKEIAKRTVVLQFITGILSVTAAYFGIGIYALLISPILSSIGIFIWNRIYYRVIFRFCFSIFSVKKIFSYSIYQFLFEFVNYFSRNLDKLLVGRYISVIELGFYEKSYRLMQLPMNNVTSVIHPVLQPVLSSFQNNTKEMADKYNKIILYVASISFPLGAALFFCANEIILIFYGEQWEAAVETFRILSVSVPLQLILSTTGAIFQACNATKNLFYVGLRNSILTISGFALAIIKFNTIEAIAWAWTLTSFACFFSSYTNMYNKVFQTSIVDMLKQLKFPILNMTFVALFIVLLNKLYLEPYNTDIVLSLALKSLIITAVTCFIWHISHIVDFKKMIMKLK